tara:strand:- start:271 stop:768 length:498 start_codon:yes stop_codon:yes gene_type:complete
MALSLRYVGARPYTEFKVNGVLYAFSRGMERNDLPEEWVRGKIIPQIENGGTAWEVVEDGETKQIAMLEVMEATPEPVVVEEVVEEPVIEEPVIEEPVIEEPVVEEVVEEPVNVEELLDANGFSQSLTRAQMMAWCSAHGLPVANTSTKASMTEQAREYIVGASE